MVIVQELCQKRARMEQATVQKNTVTRDKCTAKPIIEYTDEEDDYTEDEYAF